MTVLAEIHFYVITAGVQTSQTWRLVEAESVEEAEKKVREYFYKLTGNKLISVFIHQPIL